VLFEYARMSPDFRFLVTPWSIRGYETAQGAILIVLAIAVPLLAVLLTTKVIGEGLVTNLAVAAVVLVGALAIPFLVDAGDVVPAWPVTWGLALVAASAVRVAVSQHLPEGVQGWSRRLAVLGSFLVLFIGTGWLLHATLGDAATPVWLLVLLAYLFLQALVLVRRPTELASYRTLINLSVIAWLMALASAATVRVTLARLQFEEIGIRPDIDDVQVTSGMLIAWLAGLIMIAGSVALWAHRREALAAEQRARTQLAAAKESAEELGEEELHVAVELEEVIGGEV